MPSISVSIERTRLTPLAEIVCSRCREPLVLHQPDVELPDQMLGTCDECKSWFLIDKVGGVMALLPRERVLTRGQRVRR